MKRKFLTLIFSLATIFLFSQGNLISVSGGYVIANVQDSELFSDDPNIKGSGWRINGTYDFNSNEGKVAYGFSVGYISVNASYSYASDSTADYQVNSVPFYFAPKYLFGNDRNRGFIKLAIGAQSATLKRTGTATDVTGSDFGFYGGAGAGFMKFVSDQVFLNFEWEIAYVTNSYYRNGMMNSFMGGIGVKF